MQKFKSILLFVIGAVICYLFFTFTLVTNVEKLISAREDELSAVTNWHQGIQKQRKRTMSAEEQLLYQ